MGDLCQGLLYSVTSMILPSTCACIGLSLVVAERLTCLSPNIRL
jgi:hypothetical protein